MTRIRKDSATDDWRPGFAKRAPNFHKVVALGESWRWQEGESVERLKAAVLTGTPDLSADECKTLLLYIHCLNKDRFAESVALSWPSTELIASQMKCSESTARGYRASLEAKSYLVRDYNRANRPLIQGAYDLAPAAARLEEMEAADDAIRDACRERRERYAESVVYAGKSGAQAPGRRRLEQSQENFSSSVRRDAGAPGGANPVEEARASRSGRGEASKSSEYRPEAAGKGAIRPPRRPSGASRAPLSPSEHAEMVRQELQLAVQVCPRLAAVVPDHVLADPSTATPALRDAIAAAAVELLPEADRNNGKTVEWGWRHHKARVITMLAIALEDPGVEHPCRYFGSLATGDADRALDLRFNLDRILRGPRKPQPPGPEWQAFEAELQRIDPDPEPEPGPEPVEMIPPLMSAPGADDPIWLAIDAKLQVNLGAGRHGAWFGRVGFHGIEDRVLTLSTPSKLERDRLLEIEFVQEILEACLAAGEDIRDVVVDRRKRFSREGDPDAGEPTP